MVAGVMGLVEVPVKACLASNTSRSARDGPGQRRVGQVVLPPARTCRLRDVGYRPSPKSV